MEIKQLDTLDRLGRYFTYATFEEHFLKAVERLPHNSYTFAFLGSSVESRSIYGIQLGHGDFKILAWSQMHGNESTSTRAIIDLLNSPDLDQYLQGKSLYIIPVLNPDGLESWTRLNANGVDLNRDAINLSQPESQILKEVIDFFEPDLALNLHGQRTFYGVADSVLPAQLSFLTPSGDESKTVTPSRLRSMAIINSIREQLKIKMSAAIGRYDDGFNINCWGDYCQSLEVPTLLFEAGHAYDDYSRDQVTQLYSECLKVVLKNCMEDIVDEERTLKSYFQIPEIKRNYCDILLNNVKSANGTSTLAVMYHEQLIDSQLHFIPMLFAINEPSILYGHRAIDLQSNPEYRDDLEVHADMTVQCESLKIRTLY